MRAFKVVVLGGPGVGKTALINKFINPDSELGDLSQQQVSFSKAVFVNGERVNFEVSEASLNEKLVGNIFIVCLDLTNKDSLSFAEKFVDKIDEDVGLGHVKFLVGTKRDWKSARNVSEIELKQFSDDHFFDGYLETSAETNENVVSVFKNIALEKERRFRISEEFDPVRFSIRERAIPITFPEIVDEAYDFFFIDLSKWWFGQVRRIPVSNDSIDEFSELMRQYYVLASKNFFCNNETRSASGVQELINKAGAWLNKVGDSALEFRVLIQTLMDNLYVVRRMLNVSFVPKIVGSSSSSSSRSTTPGSDIVESADARTEVEEPKTALKAESSKVQVKTSSSSSSDAFDPYAFPKLINKNYIRFFKELDIWWKLVSHVSLDYRGEHTLQLDAMLQNYSKDATRLFTLHTPKADKAAFEEAINNIFDETGKWFDVEEKASARRFFIDESRYFDKPVSKLASNLADLRCLMSDKALADMREELSNIKKHVHAVKSEDLPKVGVAIKNSLDNFQIDTETTPEQCLAKLKEIQTIARQTTTETFSLFSSFFGRPPIADEFYEKLKKPYFWVPSKEASQLELRAVPK